ncbi:capsular polysaccharide biosynthesis protein [Microbulbifer sp. GL-2]|uniref:capsular polysaccharide biosynthesis protein n=1 Tax=Microbulbifer sp. GL-2 TaxID=2591606 RepID=UPI001163B659|nr:capsule polysaccharide modification protein LipA [Microbulbifer sp. GL-2]
MVGWGLKATAAKAQRMAGRANLPYASIEDGFLRSLGLGVNGAQPHSLIVDNTGIYYDASRPNDLESLIKNARYTTTELERAVKGLNLLRGHRLCKYNTSIDTPLNWSVNQSRVLVVDQTKGDESVRGGLASEQHFKEMLEGAIFENPKAEIVVKIHPDVITGKKQGYLRDLAEEKGCRVIAEDISPWAIFDRVEKVYVVSSQLGLDALIAGKEVHCYGLPFYAGWGLTKDRQSSERRGIERTLAEVFHAAYLQYCRYINPYTGRKCEFEDTVKLIAEQKRQWNRFRGNWQGIGFSPWKRGFIPRFLGGKARVDFSRLHTQVQKLEANTNILIWANRASNSLKEDCSSSNLNLWRVEDGFLRSVGLGADLVSPNSLVFDSRGIYFDARYPSDLEFLLNTENFSEPLLERARKLWKILVEKGLTKYNVSGNKVVSSTDICKNKKVILVPGQVESDASIAYGSPKITTNFSLLERVRRDCPGAYIIYKPHPDVVAGARIGALPASAQSLYDSLLEDGDISSLLDDIDEVHTLSSLSGFEALLRGIRVVTYGLPFYAGWGLTEDKLINNQELIEEDLLGFRVRRQRNLSLDQLIAATLLLYPVYIDRNTGEYIDAETTVELLQRERVSDRRENSFLKLFRWYRNRFLRY